LGLSAAEPNDTQTKDTANNTANQHQTAGCLFITPTSFGDFLFMDVNRTFNPEDLTRKIVSEETNLMIS
jgi:hypothetical protein